MSIKSFQHGRRLEDYRVGDTHEHPWELTVDQGTVALFQASFLDVLPTFASARYARELGMRDRPLPTLLLLNLGLSFSVHDRTEHAVADRAYVDARFPNACYAGDTLTSASTVLAVKPASTGDRGVVHVRTVVSNQDDRVVCTFEHKGFVRGGTAAGRPASEYPPAERRRGDEHLLPVEVRESVRPASRKAGFPGFVEDFAVGDVLVHADGKSVSEVEPTQLASLLRSPRAVGPAGKGAVDGGLVFGWVASLASRDTCGNVVWDVRYDNGAHPGDVVSGDTLYAASKVLAVTPHDSHSAMVTFRLVGVKNARPSELLAAGIDLFTSELRKEGEAKKAAAKVFEIDRTVLMRRRA